MAEASDPLIAEVMNMLKAEPSSTPVLSAPLRSQATIFLLSASSWRYSFPPAKQKKPLPRTSHTKK